MTPTRATRRGVTLIELLVVMAIITGLGLLALMLLPGITSSDKVLKGTEEVRSTLKVAQALAAGSRQPRGVRFLVQRGANNTEPIAGNRFATEMQLLEAPQVVNLDPKALVAVVPPTTFDPVVLTQAGSNRVGYPTGTAPYVELIYDLYTGSQQNPRDESIDPRDAVTPAGGQIPQGSRRIPDAGTIRTRHCHIRNLSPDQRAQVVPGAMLVMPALGAWSRISQVHPYVIVANDPRTNQPILSTPDEIELEFYPDLLLGAGTAYRTYHAGIYGPPVPLLGQPTIPLPKDVAVDMDISEPMIPVPTTGPNAGRVSNYDIMFAPDGQTLSVSGLTADNRSVTNRPSNAGIYLWVRDVTNITNPTPVSGSNRSMRRQDFPTAPPENTWAGGFRRGGEHHAVGINNGNIGTAPIQWPDPDGSYGGAPLNPKGGPFTFVKRRTN